jgi:flagellar basal-body rod protein FlgC
LSGLEAAARRAEASAANVANVRTATRIAEAKLEAGAAPPSASAGGYRPVRVHQESLSTGGVRATLAEIDPPHAAAYDPEHPLADEAGLIALPRVEVANEFVDLMRAQRAFEANLKALRAEDRMAGSLLDIIE